MTVENNNNEQDATGLEDFLLEMNYFLHNYLDEESETWYAMKDLIEQFKERFNIDY